MRDVLCHSTECASTEDTLIALPSPQRTSFRTSRIAVRQKTAYTAVKGRNGVALAGWGAAAVIMKDPQRRKELAELVARRRQELGDRPDISQRMRKLSASSARNPIGPTPVPHRTLLTLLGGGIAAVVLVACVATAVAVTAGGLWFQSQLNDPSTTVQKFYTALHQQDYPDAYSLLSNNAKAHVSQSQFTNQYSSLDQIKGVVDDYPVLKSTTGDNTATITVAVVRRGDSSTAQVETVQLLKDGSDWQINGITDSGTIPAPSPTS